VRIEISSTNLITALDGVPVRVWEGTTERGVKCKVFVHRLAVANNENQAQFDQELTEQFEPGRAIPLRYVLG
jgi:hypothetical protein